MLDNADDPATLAELVEMAREGVTGEEEEQDEDTSPSLPWAEELAKKHKEETIERWKRERQSKK